MEERKRRRATAVAISKFREEHPSYSDEHIANLVEKICPGIYDNDLETAVEVVKELYREQEDWTDENFARLLKEMTKQNRLISYTKEEKHRLLIEEKTKDLIEYIYKEAPNRDFHLSDCQEWNDPDVRKYFNERYAYNDRTLAQTFFTLLNQKALYEKNMLSGFVLPFHCYTEPNGDVIFTRTRRNAPNSQSGSGCLFTFLFLVLIMAVSLFSIAACSPADPGIKNAEKYIRDRLKTSSHTIKEIKYEFTDSVIAISQIERQFNEVLRTQSYRVPTDTLNFILGQTLYHATCIIKGVGKPADIVREGKYEPRRRHRFTVTSDAGLYTIDIIMDRDGLTPFMSGRDYEDKVNEIDRNFTAHMPRY